MQVKDFHVEDIKGASELLDLLTDPPKYAKLLKDLTDLLAAVNGRLAQWKEYESLEAFRTAALQKADEARSAEIEAQHEREKTIFEINRIRKDQETRAKEQFAALALEKEAAFKRQEELTLKERELVKREEAAAKDLMSAEKLESWAIEKSKEAQALEAEARAMKADLAAKLEQVKLVVGG